MDWSVAGIIEGFYGTPWTWDERLEVLSAIADFGLADYVYAPKDDALHRERWREPYPASELANFERLVGESGARVGFALSPGLSIDYRSRSDRVALAAKIDAVLSTGIETVCLALDDIPPREGLGADHAEVTTFVRDHVGDRARLLLVPTDYTSTVATPYLDALAAGLPDEVLVAWTGPTVVCDRIEVAEARARAGALGDRPPLIWDNYPCNDTVMSDQLFLGPLRGREAGLRSACSGYLANPMVQPRASILPLASTGAFVRGDDPVDAWQAEADRRRWRVFAEAVDGAVPHGLVDALASARPASVEWAGRLSELRAWFKAAAACDTPGLEEEAGPWRDQVRAEADIGMIAIRLLERLYGVGPRAGEQADPVGAAQIATMLAVAWRQVAASTTTVLGPRRAVRPVLSNRADGTWVFHRASLLTGHNALDALVDHALDCVDGQ